MSRSPHEITNANNMLEKLISLIFHTDIPHDELTNVVYFFVQIFLCFSENSQKLYRMPTARKWRTLSASSNNTRTSLLKCAKAITKKFIFVFNFYICVGTIDKLYVN